MLYVHFQVHTICLRLVLQRHVLNIWLPIRVSRSYQYRKPACPHLSHGPTRI